MPVELIFPRTSKVCVGAAVPIPKEPALLTASTELPALSRTVSMAYRISTEVSFALFENALSTVRLVLLNMVVTVRVSPDTVMRSPTTNSVVNEVLKPVTSVLTIGSIAPVRIAAALPVVRTFPATSNLVSGDEVPTPTIVPFEETYNAPAPAFNIDITFKLEGKV